MDSFQISYLSKGRMNKISMLMPVYNEEKFIFYSLENTLKYVDEAIIVDGSQYGPSTDKTKDIIDKYVELYPGKITYLSGTFAKEDGSWDESAQRNLGLSKVTGDFLMPHCGDMIYTNDDMSRMFDAVDKFRDKKIFFCIFIEFWLDQRHIRMYKNQFLEEWFYGPAISDIPIVARDIIREYINGPGLPLVRTVTPSDFIFIPHAYRYHYGWVSGFGGQVRKHIRNMSMGAWEGSELDIRHLGKEAIAKWAINHVLQYPDSNGCFDYYGIVPLRGEYTYMDNYEEAIKHYEEMYGEGFWRE